MNLNLCLLMILLVLVSMTASAQLGCSNSDPSCDHSAYCQGCYEAAAQLCSLFIFNDYAYSICMLYAVAPCWAAGCERPVMRPERFVMYRQPARIEPFFRVERYA